MRRRRAPAGLTGALMAGALTLGAPLTGPPLAHPSVHLSAQTSPTIHDVGLSADSVEIGDRVDLSFTLRLPEGTVAFLPDSLAAGAVEPFAPVEWTAEETADGAIRLSVLYPLVVFGTGPLTIPEVDLFVAPAEDAIAAGLASMGDRVGSWDSFREAPSAVPSARLLTVPGQSVQAASVLVLDDITTQIVPRPPADVSGGSRDWASTALVAFFGLLLVGVATVSTRDWMASRADDPPPPPSARDEALAALDALLEEGLHREGRVQAFYVGWSDVVRRYVEDFADDWSPAWTSTELISDLQGRRRGVAIERALTADAIAVEMRLAEEVKFGGLRPDADTAEAHLRGARDWIASSRLPHRTETPEADG